MGRGRNVLKSMLIEAGLRFLPALDLAPCLVFPFVIHPELGALEHLPEFLALLVFF